MCEECACTYINMIYIIHKKHFISEVSETGNATYLPLDETLLKHMTNKQWAATSTVHEYTDIYIYILVL